MLEVCSHAANHIIEEPEENHCDIALSFPTRPPSRHLAHTSFQHLLGTLEQLMKQVRFWMISAGRAGLRAPEHLAAMVGQLQDVTLSKTP